MTSDRRDAAGLRSGPDDSEESNRGMPAGSENRSPAAPSASQRSDEYFRTLIENTSDIVTILNEDGTIRYESPSIERLLGYKADELIGRQVMDFIHPEDRPAAIKTLEQAIHDVGVTYSTEVRFRHRSGSWHIVEAVGKRLTDPPEIAGLVMTSRDVTERRRIEEEARRHQAELSYLLRLSTMAEMASGIAHELNQPLTAIINYAKGCARRIRTGIGEPAEILPVLEEVAAQAMRAGEMIRQVRNFVRKSQRRREMVDLNALVRGVARLVEAEARQHAVRMQLDLAPRIPSLFVDAVQIEQVILSLVRNGLEAVYGSKRDTREVVLHTSMASDDAVEIAVCDSGEGLPQEIAERVFDPFVSTKASGLGMGLSISRSIVEAYGGRLWAAPNANHGTTFRFTLPLDKKGEPAAER
ncbi:MAG: nitrogen regulation protein NR(II) [Candidatus Binatia bacterium]